MYDLLTCILRAWDISLLTQKPDVVAKWEGGKDVVGEKIVSSSINIIALNIPPKELARVKLSFVKHQLIIS